MFTDTPRVLIQPGVSTHRHRDSLQFGKEVILICEVMVFRSTQCSLLTHERAVIEPPGAIAHTLIL